MVLTTIGTQKIKWVRGWSKRKEVEQVLHRRGKVWRRNRQMNGSWNVSHFFPIGLLLRVVKCWSKWTFFLWLGSKWDHSFGIFSQHFYYSIQWSLLVILCDIVKLFFHCSFHIIRKCTEVALSVHLLLRWHALLSCSEMCDLSPYQNLIHLILERSLSFLNSKWDSLAFSHNSVSVLLSLLSLFQCSWSLRLHFISPATPAV